MDASALGAAAVIVVFGLVITSEQILRYLVRCRQDSRASQQVRCCSASAAIAEEVHAWLQR